MHEIFPIVAAVVMALAVYLWVAPRMRIIILAAGSVVFGTIASFISGELFVSWAYLALDIAQVLLSSSITIAFITLRRRRSTQVR